MRREETVVKMMMKMLVKRIENLNISCSYLLVYRLRTTFIIPIIIKKIYWMDKIAIDLRKSSMN